MRTENAKDTRLPSTETGMRLHVQHQEHLSQVRENALAAQRRWAREKIAAAALRAAEAEKMTR